MLYLFIAVLAVLLIMNVFMLFVLRQMTGATGRQVEKDAGRLFGIYDAMLEEKSRQLEALKRQEETLAKSLTELEGRYASYEKPGRGNGFVPEPPMQKAEFHDGDFAYTYHQVKEAFSMPKTEFAQAFKAGLPAESEEEKMRRGVLESLRELLSFENLYQISILPLEQQKLLLEQVFTEEQAEIYRQWKESRQGYTVTDFSDWLDYQLTEVERRVVVKTAKTPAGNRSQAGEEGSESVEWEEDSSICEGVKILYQNRLYDYSI